MRKPLFVFCLILFLTLPIRAAFADCTNPAATPGTIIYNGDQNVPQVCADSAWIVLGTLNPAAGGSGCTNPAGVEGDILYNGDIHIPQYCDGDDWRKMIGTVGSIIDATPDIFDFTDQTGLGMSQQYESDIVQVAGLSDAIGTANLNFDTAVSGQGSPQYRICADASCSSVITTWASAPSTMENAQYVQLRATTSASASTTQTINFNVATVTVDWAISTGIDPCAGSPSIGTTCGDGTVYAGLSPDGNVPMYTTAADEGLFAWNNGNNSGYTTTGQTSSSTGEASTTNLLTIDSDSGVGGTQPHLAAQQCANSTANGHSDWYLPAKDELSVLYTNRVAIGGFTNSWFLSSTESNSTNIWVRDFQFGNSNASRTKDQLTYVRCVRK